MGAGQGPQGWGRDSCRHTSEFARHAASSGVRREGRGSEFALHAASCSGASHH